MLTFLHLSDLHITCADAGTQFDRDLKIREALIDDLGKDGRTNFDAILVTGDIAFHGRAEEFDRAKTWFEDLRLATNSLPEALFVVPGNHDVNQSFVSKGSSLWELHQSLRQISDNETRQQSLEKKLKDPYDFLLALTEYRAFATECGCPTEPKDLAWVQVLNNGAVLEDQTSIRFHGLNSALISDCDDKKANLLLGEQFNHFDSKPGYVNVVLCHHPQAWLLDGNKANDHFRTQAQIVLSGHDHESRCYVEGNSLRVFAGALHPDRAGGAWEPCYNVLRVSVGTAEKRELCVSVETRIWRDRDQSFQPYSKTEHRINLPEIAMAPVKSVISDYPNTASVLYSEPVKTNSTDLTADAFAAARRKLIVHFFRLGVVGRLNAAIEAGVWEDSYDAFTGQAKWMRVFEKAEQTEKIANLWDAVASRDVTLTGQDNPFTKRL